MIGPALRLLPLDLLRVARNMSSSGRGLACRLFESEAARRVLPGLALHVDAGPDDRFGWPAANALKMRQDKGHTAEVAVFLDRVQSGGQPLIPFSELAMTTEASGSALSHRPHPP